MSEFPKIASVCPFLERLDSVMDGDFCTMCKRDVHDLTDMDDAERRAFMDACGGDACVKYTMRLSPALAAAALAASAAILVPAPAMAQRHKARPHHARVPTIQQFRQVAVMTAGVPAIVEPPKPADAKPAEPLAAADDRRTELKPE